MKPSTKESIKAVLVLASVLLVILVVIPVVTWMAMGWMQRNTEKGLKAKLNNPVINADFEGWKYAEVPGWLQFKVPGEWEIREEENVLHIYGEDGTEIAFGAKNGSEDVAFADRTELLKHISGLENPDVEETTIKDFASISNSTFTKLAVGEKAEAEEYYCITLASSSVRIQSDLCLLFPAEQVTDVEELIEIAQAVVFSFAFGS